MSNRRIKLTRFDPDIVNMCYLSGYRIVIQAEGFGMTSNIFIYRQTAANPYTGESDDIFQTVAGPVDLEEYPELVVEPDTDFPFFRKSYIDIVVRSTKEAEEIWNQVKQEVCILVEAVCRLEQLKLKEEFWCPGPPDTPETSSDSSEGSIGSTDSFGSSASSANSL